MKKLLLGLAVLGCMGGTVSAHETYVTWYEFQQVANDVYDLHNDQLILHFRQQDEINQLKKDMGNISQYDDTNLKSDINSIQTQVSESVKQISSLSETQDKLQAELQKNTNALNTFKSETRRGIAGAVAIAGLERPAYDPNHKFSIMVGTGTYKGTTAVAYGVSYTPNSNMVFSVKGTDDEVSTSMGFNL